MAVDLGIGAAPRADWGALAARLRAVLRRNGPALGVAAVVHGLVLGFALLSFTRPVVSEAPVIEVTLAPSSLFERARAAPARVAIPPTEPRPRPARSEIAPPAGIAAPPALPPARTPPPPAPSRWSLNPPAAPITLGGGYDGAPIAGLDPLRACSDGNMQKLSPAARAACEGRWARFKPDGPAKPAYPLKDPHGDWAKAAARQEARRQPITQSPVHACHTDNAMNNLASGCTD